MLLLASSREVLHGHNLYLPSTQYCKLNFEKLSPELSLIWRGSKLWQLSTCSVIALLKYIQVFTSSMTGRAYTGEVLIQILAEIHEEMSELLDKQVSY